ncbi:MAG: transporter substrate-binding domain-containing protein [Caldilineaceae bacterium]
MDTPTHSAMQRPRIDCTPGVKLTNVQESLLRQAFADQTEVFVEKRFDSGYSGAETYVLSFRDQSHAPAVIKFDHPVTLQREYAACQNFVKDKLLNIAPTVLERLTISEDGQAGLLAYMYAGPIIGQSQSLSDYFGNKSGAQTATVLDHIFRLFGGPWWGNAKARRIAARWYYDRLLPVHLQLKVIPCPVAEAMPLRASEVDPLTLAKVGVGQIFALHGFRVTKVKAGVLTLSRDLPPDSQTAPIRLKLEGTDARPGELLAPQAALVIATREMLLDDLVRQIMPDFNRYGKEFTVDGCTLPNPLAYLQPLLDETYATEISTIAIHGDLHLQNILVDVTDRPWLIDFAETTKGPVLFDLQCLEVQVLTHLLFHEKVQPQKRTKLLIAVLQALHKPTLTPKAPHPSVQKAYTVLVALRQLARQYLVKEQDWTEYYRGLTLVLLAALKFDGLNAEARRLAFIGAAVTLPWTGLHGVKPLAHPARFPFKWVGFSLAPALLMLLSLLLFPTWPLGVRHLFPGYTTTVAGSTATAGLPTAKFGITKPNDCTRAIPDVVATPLPKPATQYAAVLQRVKARGVLLCGVEGTLPGFSLHEEKQSVVQGLPAGFYSNASGFDADFCRVVATSIFGDYAGKVAFLNLNSAERFAAVSEGKVDVLIRNTTWTAGRDTGLHGDTNRKGIDFGPVLFHDGQKFIVRTKQAINKLEDLKGKRICVQPATTTLTNTIAISNQLNLALHIITESRGKPFGDTEAVVAAYALQPGTCDAMTGDESQLVTRQEFALSEHKIIPEDAISYEPLAPALSEDDSQWRDVVSYAIWTTIYAEEIGVTQGNVAVKSAASAPLYQQFLNDAQIGKNLGLTPTFARKIIEKLGNYGEIYACNLGDVMPNRGPNQPFLWYDEQHQRWSSNPGGRLFSPPFVPY